VHQLLDHRFVERLTAMLARHGLPADAIELELTETAFQTSAPTVEALQRIREGGLGLALDDFGIGYSSLTSLSRLPLRRVKLDRSLIVDVPANRRAESLARSIISVCQNLGLGVTVEGIERNEQLGWLSRCGPVHAQGFLIGRPMTAAEVPEFVRNGPKQLDALLARAAPGAGGLRPVNPVLPFRRT
jgi:EAL domain-containing protein (putative c-di-GMP-specific phosphodiesterase class I)